jgi:hypothetical protein
MLQDRLQLYFCVAWTPAVLNANEEIAIRKLNGISIHRSKIAFVNLIERVVLRDDVVCGTVPGNQFPLSIPLLTHAGFSLVLILRSLPPYLIYQIHSVVIALNSPLLNSPLSSQITLIYKNSITTSSRPLFLSKITHHSIKLIRNLNQSISRNRTIQHHRSNI